MKNMVYCLLCNLLLVLLIILSSCSRQDAKAAIPDEVQKSESCQFCLRQVEGHCCSESVQLPLVRKDNDTSVQERMLDKSQKDFIRWSTSGGM
jgi:nitrous oxide reductase accessory protein NosL